MGFFSLKSMCDCCHEEMGLNKYKYKDGYVCPTCNKKVLKRLNKMVWKVTVEEARKIIEDEGDNWNKCDACGGKLGVIKYPCQDGIICSNCLGLSVRNLKKPVEKITLEELQPYVNQVQVYEEKLNSFTPTKKIGNFFEVDENQGEWLVPSKKHPRIFKFGDIVSYELLVDETSVASGGVGRAIAGGVLFGGAGAIVGGITGKKRSKNVINSMKIKITVNDLQYPVVYINIINSKIKTNSLLYKPLEKAAQECLSVLDLLVNRSNKNQYENNQVEVVNKDFMFCKECGAKIPRNSKFCSECGEQIL